MKIYIEDDTWTQVIREGTGQWDNDDTDTTHNFGKAFIVDGARYDALEVGDAFKKGDTAYIVIAVWSTGDSFGSNSGACSEIMSAHKDEETAIKAKAILEKSDGGSWLPDGFRCDYRPWSGYFENLDYITIEERILK